MRCDGEFRDDRICDLCALADRVLYNHCFAVKLDKIEKANKLNEIQCKCPYCITDYDEYTKFDACKLKREGIRYGNCNVTLECENHIK